MKNPKILCLLCSVLVFAACGKDNNEGEKPGVEEQELYDRYVTEEMAAAIERLNMPVYRGINPPIIEGYYRMEAIFLATTNPAENSRPGEPWNDYKFNFYDQKGFKISVRGYEAEPGTDILDTEHNGNGTFITGEGDNFTVFLEERTTDGRYTSVILSIISAEAVRDGGKVTGFRNIRYGFIMKDRGGNPDKIREGQGRIFGDGEVIVITEEQFETLTRAAGGGSGGLQFAGDTDHPVRGIVELGDRF